MDVEVEGLMVRHYAIKGMSEFWSISHPTKVDSKMYFSRQEVEEDSEDILEWYYS